VPADAEASRAASQIDPAGIKGSLVICGGGRLPEAVVKKHLELAGGDQARIVIIPTAAQRADNAEAGDLLRSWRRFKTQWVKVLHTRSKERANDPEFVAPLKEATGVWFDGGQQSRIAEAYEGTAVERELHALLDRGGVIGGTSAGAAVMSRVMIARGNPVAEIAVGLDLLPDAVIDQHFLKRNRKPRLLAVLEKHPGLVGFGIDEGTALIVQGRRLEVLGDSSVTVCLAASESCPAREIILEPGDTADLTALRRDAAARRAPPDRCPETVHPGDRDQ
jgi:cyanophycinase